MTITAQAQSNSLAETIFAGGGKMGALMRNSYPFREGFAHKAASLMQDLAHNGLSSPLATVPGVSFQFKAGEIL